MLGAAEDRIQSVRARVAGEFVPEKSTRRQGSCPICGADSVAVRNQDGSIQYLATKCDGNGTQVRHVPNVKQYSRKNLL